MKTILGLVGHDARAVFHAIDGLVHPVPNAGANDARAALDDVPVVLQVAYGLSHGMGIFADEVGTILDPILIACHIVHRGIHAGIEVRSGRIAPVGRTLIVDGSAVEGLHGRIGLLEVEAASRLVAQGPERDAGVVAVARHHAHVAVHILSGPVSV